MLDLYSLKAETRYGCPAADQIIINRNYVVGYSYYFRQAKWALEIVDPDKKVMSTIERLNNFRPDYRIPKRFRADLSDYTGSGYDRGHLVASANQNDTHIQNSETFLLSNMSPQKKELNRQIWRELESAVRKLDAKSSVLETYVICGPIFDFTHSIQFIGENDKNGIKVPIPSHFFKCVLTEENSGRLKMWAFEMPNKKLTGSIGNYRVSTAHIEQRAGITLWDNLLGQFIDKEKNKVRAMWR
ncbi:DNA/RNA non-specific endonuclease [Dasania sp. GY-MA-18]|uniref:Endonuclease n=1 Tax=Dasania phycosphaerae TaxID=2950436 RepID=A0A9J6RJ00_9GAMM|nr:MULTISPECIES: DNA/RNA non-specific endonuclease [Dasania]MCR8921917.1 DNA/RNA non-specific endonuclease [Dasania sp. GY-MA-18]MCZ0864345.1 DNA/RNA non-specific endonuclease [Dasania phycosphaerae]MCZ0868073.1 DNA/RNA non-specific endonuclease [Dasania phycosphaerae]